MRSTCNGGPGPWGKGGPGRLGHLQGGAGSSGGHEGASSSKDHGGACSSESGAVSMAIAGYL